MKKFLILAVLGVSLSTFADDWWGNQVRQFDEATRFFAEGEHTSLDTQSSLNAFRARLLRALRSYYVNHDFDDPLRKEVQGFSNSHLREALKYYERVEHHFHAKPLTPLLDDEFVRKYRLRYFVFQNPSSFDALKKFAVEIGSARTLRVAMHTIEDYRQTLGERPVLFLLAQLLKADEVQSDEVKDGIMAALIAADEKFFMEQLAALRVFNDDSVRDYPLTAAAIAERYFADGGLMSNRPRFKNLSQALFDVVFSPESLQLHSQSWAPIVRKNRGLGKYLLRMQCTAALSTIY